MNNERIATLLRKLRERPGMYLGHDSLPLLQAFLNGYVFAGGEGAEELQSLLREFGMWIGSKYSVASAHDWCSIIQFYHRRESEAFEAFFGLMDEFLDSRAKDP